MDTQSTQPMTNVDRVPISKRIVLINSLSAVLTRLLTVGAFAWVIQHLMKRIPEAELAMLPVVMSIAMVIPLLQTILTSGLARFVTEAYARNDLAGVTRIVSSQFPLLLGGGVVTMLLGGLVAWQIDKLLNIPPGLVGSAQFMMLLLVGRIAIGIVLAPFNTGLFANQRFVLQNTIELVSLLLRITIMLWLILGIGPRVEWVIVAQVSSQVFGQVLSAVLSMRMLPSLRFRRASFDWATCHAVLSFGGWNFITETASMIRRAADVPILNLYSTPIAVNDFFLGSTVDIQLREMTIRATMPLLPALTAMHAQGQQSRLGAAFLRGARVALWVSMFCAIPLIVLSYDLFALYLQDKYDEHVDAATVMIILLLGIPLTNTSSIFGQIAHARGEIRPIAILGVVSQLANLALTLVLVIYFQMGAIGAATASLFTYAIVNPFFIWPLALRTLQLPWRRLLVESLLPGLAPSVVTLCAALTLLQLLPDNSLVRVAVGLPFCPIAYTIALWFVLRPADRADLARIRQAIGA
jgi:O-antigen/teichoic acid export membrane protein